MRKEKKSVHAERRKKIHLLNSYPVTPEYFLTVDVGSLSGRCYHPYLTYTDPPQSLFPKKINMGLIYTMNFTEEQMKTFGLGQILAFDEMILGMIFGASESLYSFDTYQFKDYSKVVSDRFDPEKKAKRREEVFPHDCDKAFEMGARFVKEGFVDQENEKGVGESMPH